MHALIIEDEYLIAHEIEEQLAELGFRSFSFARSEDAAIAAASDKRPDLITADVRLLPGNGVTAVESICSPKRCPVIFITGFPWDVETDLPGAQILRKPFKKGELKKAVSRILAANSNAA